MDFLLHFLTLFGVLLILGIVVYETFGGGFKNMMFTRKIFLMEEIYKLKEPYASGGWPLEDKYIGGDIPTLEDICRAHTWGDDRYKQQAARDLAKFYERRR